MTKIGEFHTDRKENIVILNTDEGTKHEKFAEVELFRGEAGFSAVWTDEDGTQYLDTGDTIDEAVGHLVCNSPIPFELKVVEEEGTISQYTEQEG